jgi:hypothetical protein
MPVLDLPDGRMFYAHHQDPVGRDKVDMVVPVKHCNAVSCHNHSPVQKSCGEDDSAFAGMA